MRWNKIALRSTMVCSAPNDTHIPHLSPARLGDLHKRVARGEVVDDNKEHCFPGATAHLNIGTCNNCDSTHKSYKSQFQRI